MLVAVGSAILAVAGLGLWQEAKRYGAAKRESLLATASAFAAASSTALAARDANGIRRAIRGIGRLPEISYASVEDQDGAIVAEIGATVRLAGDLDLTDAQKSVSVVALLTTATVGVSVPVIEAGMVVGGLHLVSETRDLVERLVAVLITAAIGAGIALAIGLAISLRLQRSITRPLVALTRVMADIRSSHDYAAQVQIRTDDEIGLLADSFNGMLQQIGERDLRLSQHRDRLEHDIAERTVDLRIAKDEADQANMAKSEFLATMSHEIRTPMNGMLVMAELLASAELPDRERRYAEVIARSGQSLLAIINDILDFSKIESGKLTLEDIPFSPADVVDTVVTLFGERAYAKGLDLAAFVAADVPRDIIGDPVRVTQILSNLVNNALKFAETGHVAIRLERAGDGLRFAVRDTGIGIAADKLPSLFTAFSQADQSTMRRYGGTGLGLSICKRLVEAMGGEIGVSSVAGEGSEFFFQLATDAAAAPVLVARPGIRPIRLSLTGEATAASMAESLRAAGLDPDGSPGSEHALIVDARTLVAQGRPTNAVRVIAVASIGDPGGAEALSRGLADCLIRRPIAQAEWREVLARLRDGSPFDALPKTGPADRVSVDRRFAHLRVLVADDSAINREVACEALSRLGIVAATAQDGRAALTAIASTRYDLVLMDGSMPDIDGYEATRLLRADEALTGAARTTVVALTAHVVGPAADDWRRSGMDGVLHKPFTIAKLTACIEQHLAGHLHEQADHDSAETDLAEVALLDPETIAGLEEMAETGAGHFIARIVAMFGKDAPVALLALRQTVAEMDMDAVRSAAHRLKSMSLNIGGAALADRLGRIEDAAHDRSAPPSPADLDEVADLLTRTCAALTARFSGAIAAAAKAA